MEFGLILFLIGLFVMVASWGFDDPINKVTIIAIILMASGFYLGFGTSSGVESDDRCTTSGSGRSSWEQCY
ncbi:hypothetical protein N9A69_03970 [Gammaproteobacteria bacterium]|jgi:hypothetical protein|nr:hypothetical protein [Gammaproteobacteria bacterium]MDA7844725.1 hypothetical protein [Gammaproteobacteria bacterium]|tara:strand:- start:1023 stop:1235 length:213 start_codon:yes stop_codon:yes gene_type:complete